jgi:hypothetical protein
MSLCAMYDLHKVSYSFVFSLAGDWIKSGYSIKKVSAKYFLTSLLLQFSIPPDLFPIFQELFMIEPRSSRLRSLSTSDRSQRNLPTGKNFSGSSLSNIQPEKLVFSIVADSISISDPALVSIEPQSPLVIEAGKILVVGIWFWCLIGANFCFDSLSTIVRYCIQDI